jgi:TamB, inner membrane protein subunit of TAM complex
LELAFDLNLTRDAQIDIILDKATEHGMSATGDGTLFLEINTLGKFKMTGDYSVDKGIYNFKYKGLIEKKFDVKPNSSITWEGDPMKARLNLEAIYKLPTGANPAVLLDNPSINRRVDVQVSIAITGNLSNPEPDFNIIFPTVSSTLKSEIQTKLNDPVTRQTQALTLLGTGAFASPEGLNQNSVYNNLFETAGDIFSNLFQNPNDKLKVALVLAAADRTPNRQTNGQIGVSFNSQINERISINGQVGVPVGGVNQSAIVGNVEILYRVNEDGTLNLRVFNRENDINYIGEGVGYTQGLGINYQVDFDTFSELVHKIFKNQKLEKINKNANSLSDDDAPDNINFNSKKKTKNKKTTKQIIEGVPPKED